MSDSVVTKPVIGAARKATIDKVVDDMEKGTSPPSNPRHPAASKPQTPERNSTYDDMESRIYGDKSAKTKR
jgi:hypothetical protein